MRLIPILFLSILLTGCACFKKQDPPIIPPNTVVNINKAALVECPELKEDITITVFGDAITAYTDLAVAYGTCAGRQATSIKLIKQLGNIK